MKEGEENKGGNKNYRKEWKSTRKGKLSRQKELEKKRKMG